MIPVRMRFTGNEDTAREIINLVTSLEGVEHVEEVADLMPHMDDEDSSSAGLSDNLQGGGFHSIEVEAPNENTARRVREIAEAAAREAGSALEFVEDF